ncbi:hypothetical protein PM10SUCC1_13310 [Propionigenium maris DSM 9537]|uniref:Mannosyl-glycoprotein endo-beta-N-acetylglucosamidase-like domain-containing protein n=1 Tax=Propionigenium maris DSM 9537 TaxID=1123000 RepID=A0A9W6LMN4_9FUSO|nr:glucosaminidase domain-containing protein [Propionigenium maris]GLI55817.1 hypothetical protein PM10SUCC1_13310 [Propionigenium maris DSM 9537]
MKKFIKELVVVYLVFSGAIFFMEGALEKQRNGKISSKEERAMEKRVARDVRLEDRPRYTVIVPKTASEILMERKGNYVYSGELVMLADLSVGEKKRAFVGLLVPAIDAVERDLQWRRDVVERLAEMETHTRDEEKFLAGLFSSYRIKNGSMEELLSKMVMPPKSLIISQGALESGWGTSRFFREGNNIFGVWSYNTNEPRIAATTRSNGYTPHLKKYESLKGSVEDYVLLLARGESYRDLRAGMRRGETSTELARHLTMYSELREEYVKRVVSVIESNKLKELD